MSSEAQAAANKANAQHSTGPRTEEGKAASSRNHCRHGLAGTFFLIQGEDPAAYEELLANLRAEHKPLTQTENLLVDRMAQHHWLRDRALILQNSTFETPGTQQDHERALALYLRYETTHERAFTKCLNDLLKVRAERRKEAFGFESQEHKRNEESRKSAARSLAAEHRQAQENRLAAAEIRAQELHQGRLRLTEAQAQLKETDIALAKTEILARGEQTKIANAA